MEYKFHDVDLDDAVIVAAGAITNSINLIAQGVTESTRVGRKCCIRSINWRYNFFLTEIVAQATPAPADILRIILYLDKQANGATATVTNILKTADFQSFNNLANKGRFRILMDRTHVLNYAAAIGVTASSDWPEVEYAGSFYKRCSIPIEFDSTAGAITEIRSNNLGVLLITRAGVAGLNSKFRLRFSDA
ncbi:hypothetical protein [Gilliamella sp. CG33]|uniref:hypothetical protein n=1 Tax=Gilliamella sp. CG33 TaxID=3351506 RepID=UPI00398638DA